LQKKISAYSRPYVLNYNVASILFLSLPHTPILCKRSTVTVPFINVRPYAYNSEINGKHLFSLGAAIFILTEPKIKKNVIIIQYYAVTFT
jgi:hypothetical protein